jgi:lysyl-tRNA synthetase class 2
MTGDGWQPGATPAALAARAGLLTRIREFFQQRGVLEVETPLLGAGTVTDPNITPIACADRWLQTSPEYAMKRLLAAGSGPIYQICKAFRHAEAGSRHNPEFTLLEWYRPGFSLADLIVEVGELVSGILGRQDWHRCSYQQLFQDYLQLDPFTVDSANLAAFARERLDLSFEPDNRDVWLDLLLSHLIEPQLAERGLLFVYDYPPTQAALARLRRDGEHVVAERFELYADGVELANGYCELTDAAEQAARFARDNELLIQAGSAPRAVDHRLLQALEQGLPACSGVALGLDRLLMVLTGAASLAEVMSFDWDRA